jgi:UDP-N-acetylglucosamine 2-epimerase (non-hydrolysing)
MSPTVIHLLHVVGARPNFMKAAPVLRALRERGVQQTLVHTGQHYDANMSDVFFAQLEIPAPDVNLGVGSGSQAAQTAEVMTRLEPVILERKPDVVLVYGDVNSTLAAALVCAKLLVRAKTRVSSLPSFRISLPARARKVLSRLCGMDPLASESRIYCVARDWTNPMRRVNEADVSLRER